MAKFDIKTTVTAPNEISIPLVRGDHHEVSGIFRVCFEVALSIFSTLLGYSLSLPSLDRIHWIGLVIGLLAVIAFLRLTYTFLGKNLVLPSKARLMPNPSLKRSTNGRPPGPSRWYSVHFHRPGPGVLPLAPA